MRLGLAERFPVCQAGSVTEGLAKGPRVSRGRCLLVMKPDMMEGEEEVRQRDDEGQCEKQAFMPSKSWSVCREQEVAQGGVCRDMKCKRS
jgi:hypothetical protein